MNLVRILGIEKGKPPMKKLLAIALLLAGAMAAQAKVGETLPQLIKRFGTNYQLHGAGIYEFRPWSSGSVTAILVDGRSAWEFYVSEYPRVNDEPPPNIVRGILTTQSPRDKWHSVTPPYGSHYAMQNQNKSLTATLQYAASQQQWSMEVGYTWAVVASHTPSAKSTSTPAPEVAVDPSRPPNDCSIVAAQAYAKLKPNTYWCQIVGIDVVLAGEQRPRGHVVVLFKYQADGQVFQFDAAGAQELDTTEQDLEAIKPEIQARLNGKVTHLRYLTH
jgi:hypothetical protein